MRQLHNGARRVGALWHTNCQSATLSRAETMRMCASHAKLEHIICRSRANASKQQARLLMYIGFDWTQPYLEICTVWLCCTVVLCCVVFRRGSFGTTASAAGEGCKCCQSWPTQLARCQRSWQYATRTIQLRGIRLLLYERITSTPIPCVCRCMISVAGEDVMHTHTHAETVQCDCCFAL